MDLINQDNDNKQELIEVEEKIVQLNAQLKALRERQLELKVKIDNSYSEIINRYRNRKIPRYNFSTSASRRWAACDSYHSKAQTVKELTKHGYPIPDWLNTTASEFNDCLSG